LDQEFETKFSKLFESETLQTKLKNNIQKLAKVSATEAIVNEVETLLGT
jgi:hypothetical protein